ncbi:aldehyde dehydrogenase [Marinicella sp. W31]|uniref:aldehyde dehydrogenase n=1 Tax=Marinicella sp. W31 TaxID=3023713 RepID=UPI0037577464
MSRSVDIQNYINGELMAPFNEHYLDNIEPATGQIYGRIPNSDATDLEMAVKAARAAQKKWAATSLDARFQILNRLADLIDANSDRLAEAESRDNGKPIALARQVDIPRASANIRFFAQAITQFASESHAMGEIAINYTLRQPLGIVACISPWNLPLYLFTWKIAPALAAGNAVIAKPSEVTPLTAYLFSQLCIEAGLPKGVLNVLHGTGPSIGGPLTTHEHVKAISFTGGTSTGQHIRQVTAKSFKKLSLELGGKNPTLVFADCDLEKTIAETGRAAFANQGQICLCGSRIYVQRKIYDAYVKGLVKYAESLRIGDPLDTETQFGAVVSETHMEKVLKYVDMAVEQGGKILTGGSRHLLQGRCESGYFLQPTVITGLNNSSSVNQEEIFGPVCTVQPFDDEKEALALANDSNYGLACSIWSSDVQRCHRLARDIECGIVWVNCWLQRDLRTPFGGMKASGIGREGGVEALRFFTEPKNVCISYG